jgi:hypothetical protein
VIVSQQYRSSSGIEAAVSQHQMQHSSSIKAATLAKVVIESQHRSIVIAAETVSKQKQQ